jgi:uncharacterized cupin superfamily protein
MTADRPGCVHVWDLPEEVRPRLLAGTPGIRAMVRAVGNSAGLTRMGVWLRTVQPGDAGTARHFHTAEEEWAYVLSGQATVRIGPHRIEVRAGSFAGFPPGPAPHHFLATGNEPLVLLEGGERRPNEDTGMYPDLGFRWGPGLREKTDEPPPPEVGERSQCLHIDELEPREFLHPVDPRAKRAFRVLHEQPGLTRQAVRWVRVGAGDFSTAFHTHDRTDEWVYLLSGKAHVRVGDAHFDAGPGDFLAHPAGGPAHSMQATTDVEYLMGGMIDPDDVVLYPDAGVMRKNGELVTLG